MFRVIPAIDLKNKKCVSLVQGIPGTERVSLDDPFTNAEPYEVILPHIPFGIVYLLSN